MDKEQLLKLEDSVINIIESFQDNLNEVKQYLVDTLDYIDDLESYYEEGLSRFVEEIAELKNELK